MAGPTKFISRKLDELLHNVWDRTESPRAVDEETPLIRDDNRQQWSFSSRQHDIPKLQRIISPLDGKKAASKTKKLGTFSGVRNTSELKHWIETDRPRSLCQQPSTSFPSSCSCGSALYWDRLE